MTNFEKAFAAARKAGKKEFSWNGKQYNTKLKEEVKKTRSGIGDKALISPPRRGQAPEPIVFRPKKQGPKARPAPAAKKAPGMMEKIRAGNQAQRDERREARAGARLDKDIKKAFKANPAPGKKDDFKDRLKKADRENVAALRNETKMKPREKK